MVREIIAFTSCFNYKHFKSQPQWDDIAARNPDYLFLLGDNVYLDYFQMFFNQERLGSPSKYTESEFKERLNEKYRLQWQESHFAELREKMKGKIFGTWDDHDFGWNNAWGNEVNVKIKEISRDLFHKYMNCSTNVPEIYCHKDIANARVIFLDNRYYADSPEKTNAKMLGEKQFEFLEEKLHHDKQYTIICAGLTLTHGSDNWAEFSKEYSRFCRLVQGRKGIIFLGGDIHKNKFGLPAPETIFRSRRPCYEIVSSGLAINYWGLPFKLNQVHNWGLLELTDKEIIVNLVNKKRTMRYRIDSETWLSAEI